MSTTIHAECRPKLRACNFFIQSFAITFVEASLEVGESAVLVSSNSPSFQLHISLPSNVKLRPGYASGLVVTTNSITFRAQVGEFSTPISKDPHLPVYTPGFQSEDAIKLSCEFCLEPLSDFLNFSRVLPMPSSEDMDDFFCHKHSEDQISLSPRASDFFYNFFVYKVNISRLNTPRDDTNTSYKCPKCFTQLGEVQNKCVKLWSCVVRVTSLLEKNRPKTALEKFLESFKYFAKDLPMQINKVVLSCSQSTGETSYTLLWILERDLPLMSSANQLRLDKFQLECSSAMKILYSHFAEQNGDTDEWIESCNSVVVPVHPTIEQFLLKYLAAQSKAIPCDSNSVNGFSVSYIQ